MLLLLFPCNHLVSPLTPPHSNPHNQTRTSAATAVSVADAALPEGFELLDGAAKATFAKIDVGSKEAHTYVVSVKTAAGPVGFEPATVTYKADADGEQQVGRARLRSSGGVGGMGVCFG
jgi:hypothetical protein